MAVLLAMKTPYESAMRAANAAAAVVVGKRGTATVVARRTAPAASCRRRRSRRKTRSCSTGRCSTSGLPHGGGIGLRIGFTNGCFDLLHRGHVKLLAEARAACDRLVVGLNSDASTARLKGQGPADQSGGRPRRGACRARSGRSRRRVRGGHAARTDQARAAGGAGQGRRLHASTRWSAATWSKAAGGDRRPGRSRARTFDDGPRAPLGRVCRDAGAAGRPSLRNLKGRGTSVAASRPRCAAFDRQRAGSGVSTGSPSASRVALPWSTTATAHPDCRLAYRGALRRLDLAGSGGRFRTLPADLPVLLWLLAAARHAVGRCQLGRAARRPRANFIACCSFRCC